MKVNILTRFSEQMGGWTCDIHDSRGKVVGFTASYSTKQAANRQARIQCKRMGWEPQVKALFDKEAE